MKLIMLQKPQYYLPLYLGCGTNKGKLVGINKQIVLTESENGTTTEHDLAGTELFIKPFLKRLNNISCEESSELVKMGFSVGRPNGYSFSPNAFLFLLSLHVDLFGLIALGLAIDITIEDKKHNG
jgi:hypothetical protein